MLPRALKYILYPLLLISISTVANTRNTPPQIATISRLTQETTTLAQQLDTEQHKLNALQQSQQSALIQLAKQHDALAQQIRQLYRLQQQQPVDTTVNHSNDILSLNRYLHYYHYLIKARLESVAQINSSMHHASLNIAAISTREQHLTTLLQQAKMRTPHPYTPETNQIALQKTLHALHRPYLKVATPSEFEQLRGKLSWPTHGKIIAHFGTWVNNQPLSGVLIKAREGSLVHPIYPGKVIFADWLRGFGLLVIIDHGKGYMSLYARNHSIRTKVGALVSRSDTLALLSNPDKHHSPVLYFEIRENGVPVNPRLWCR